MATAAPGAGATLNETVAYCQNNNAAWVQSFLFRGYRTSDRKPLEPTDIVNLANTLENNGVRYAYLFSGPYRRTGSLPNYPFTSHAMESAAFLRSLYPELVLLPWIGGLQDKTVHLDSDQWIDRAIAHTVDLTQQHNLAGVHINFEYVLPRATYVVEERDLPTKRLDPELYGQRYNLFLKKLRNALPDAFISIVVPSTVPFLKGWKRPHTLHELREASQYVDQIAVMFYDISVNDQATFKRGMKLQLEHILDLKQTSTQPPRFLLGLGTFVNGPELQQYRSIEIEKIPNWFQTLADVSQDRSDLRHVLDGFAAYAEWETDAAEWQDIRFACH